ncbi:hypothetical protein, partial [Burkholderia pseudomallei]|uniref:hypothetical protein n=1 Tax=Burkholderia pseudomallei TaxID=28450 RepID=UPI001C83BBF1
RPTSSSSGIVQLKQPRPFSKIEMARRNQAGHRFKKANVTGFRLILSAERAGQRRSERSLA